MITKKYKKFGKTHTFLFTKITSFDFDPSDPTRHIFLAKQYENRLIDLKNENFNRIKIPNYTLKRDDNVITVNVEFIKGEQLNYLNKDAYKKIILEDLVLRLDVYGERKTFYDYAFKNFIIEDTTKELYYVDLEHYGESEKPLHHHLEKFYLRFY